MVWDVNTARKVQDISCVFQGPVICVRWVDLGKGDNLAFIVGCADGSLQVFQRNDVHVSLNHRCYFLYLRLWHRLCSLSAL